MTEHWCPKPRQMIDGFYYAHGKRDWPIDTIWPCPECGKKWKMYKQWENHPDMGDTYNWTPVRWYEKAFWKRSNFEWKEDWA